MSGTFLAEMAHGSRARVAAAKRVQPEGALQRLARAAPASPPLTLHPQGFDLIAEVKLRSPAAGALATRDEDITARVAAYAAGGAAAISVLTEPSRFDGRLEHLAAAAAVLAPLGVPALRKDFLVDPYQVLEARAAGAGGVLVILRLLPREELAALIECARELGMFVLLEAFDAADLELLAELVAAHAPAVQLLAGVNCRDLATLEVVPARLLQLAPRLPVAVPRVAESGVASASDAQRVRAAGYQLALVGSALMRGGEPRALTAQLLAAARAPHGAAP